MQDFNPITTSPSFHQHHTELFVPSSTSLTPYALPYETGMIFTSEAGNMGGYSHNYSSEIQEHNSLDAIPIIPCDQVTGNPIRFYSDCTKPDLSPRPFVDTTYPNGPFASIKPEPPVKGND